MEIIVKQAEWTSPNDVKLESKITVTEDMTMGDIELFCRDSLKEKIAVKDGLLTYTR